MAATSRRRQTLLHIGLPLCGVGLIIGFLLGIAVYADSANRAGVLGLSDTLLHATQERIALQVSAYLEPAAHATLLAHTMLGRGAVTDHLARAHDFAASVLLETPQIANVLFADAAGNFMLVRRAAGGTPGSTETKRILQSPSGRSVTWTTQAVDGSVTATHQDPADTYDARTTSWFTGARAASEVFWSGVYVFFTERAPGITAAVHGPDPDPDVVGVDIRLDAISRFLGGLLIGQTGRAYIVAKDGAMIAGPDATRILLNTGGTLAPARIDQIGDPDLVAGWDHFRAQGPGQRIIEVGGRRLISIVAPLTANDQALLLFITVPEAEFSGFVTANTRRAALLSLVVVALAAGLGVLLVRQGLRADRAARTVAERSTAVRQQSAAFARLATQAGMFDATGAPANTLSETLAEATGARRAGIWRLSKAGQVLRCDDSFEPAAGGHVGGVELSCQEIPALIEAMMAGEPIDVADAAHDRRTVALYRSLMAPFGSTALFAVPILQAGRAVGLVLLEDARRDPAAQDFARACATLVGLGTPGTHAPATLAPTAAPSLAPRLAPRLAHVTADATGTDASATAPTAPLADAAMPTASASDPSATQTAAPDAAPAVDASPADQHGLDPALAEDRPHDPGVPQAVVLVLTLPDIAIPVAHQIACMAQDIATRHAIPYVKMLGTTIVAAAGYGADTHTGANTGPNTHTHTGPTTGTALAAAAPRLAAAAITLRDRCAALFEEADGDAGFGIGLDVGSVLASPLGGSPAVFNLWGPAVHGAGALAASAPADTIQASEQAYRLLRQDFLLRPRGLFHRPRTGEARSYVLAGHV